MGDKKQIVVLGTGGVGAVVLYVLSAVADVTAIVRSDYEEVSKNGFSYDSVDYGKIDNFKPHAVAKSIEDAASRGPYDYVVVCTKFIPELQKTEDLIKPLVSKGTGIVLIQNGIGNEEPVAKAFPDAYVIGGVSMVGSANYGGKIIHSGPDSCTFGTFDKRPEAVKATKDLVDIYNKRSIGEYSDDLQFVRWKKLIYNSAYNTISALTGVDTGRMFFADMAQTVVLDAMKEVRAIAEADLKGKKLPEGVEQFMIDSDGGIYYEPSMLVDVKKGQLMELDGILGNPLRYAKKNNVDAPVLKTIYTLLRGVQFRIMESKGLVKLPQPRFDRQSDKPYWNTLPWTE